MCVVPTSQLNRPDSMMTIPLGKQMQKHRDPRFLPSKIRTALPKELASASPRVCSFLANQEVVED
jgi:hypothetical protein